MAAAEAHGGGPLFEVGAAGGDHDLDADLLALGVEALGVEAARQVVAIVGPGDDIAVRRRRYADDTGGARRAVDPRFPASLLPEGVVTLGVDVQALRGLGGPDDDIAVVETGDARAALVADRQVGIVQEQV